MSPLPTLPSRASPGIRYAPCAISSHEGTAGRFRHAPPEGMPPDRIALRGEPPHGALSAWHTSIMKIRVFDPVLSPLPVASGTHPFTGSPWARSPVSSGGGVRRCCAFSLPLIQKAARRSIDGASALPACRPSRSRDGHAITSSSSHSYVPSFLIISGHPSPRPRSGSAGTAHLLIDA